MTEEPRGTDPAVAPGQQATFSHRQILAILSGLMLGMFLAALDQTIVATAMRTIADDLDGYALQAWVTTAYLITATLVTPLYGKLSDIYGRKQFFMAAIVLFVIGSVLCTFAQSMYMLAVFRAIQGLGAGACSPSPSRSSATSSPRASEPATRATSWPCSARRASSAR